MPSVLKRTVVSALFGAILAVSSGCSDNMLTQSAEERETAAPFPTLAMAYPTTGHTIRDGSLEIHLDSMTGILRVTDVSNGHTVYARPDAEVIADLVDFIAATRAGDQIFDLTEYLNPYENAPENIERIQPGLRVASGTFDHVGRDIVSTGRPVLVRPTGESPTRYSAGTSGLPHMSIQLDDPWNFQCPEFAQQIGAQRLAYLQERGWAASEVGSVLSVNPAELTWENGYPFVGLTDLRTAFVSAGIRIAEVLQRSVQLDIMIGTYNLYRCQQPITVQAPHPGYVFVPPTNGGGGAITCETLVYHYEISYDGGNTWYPFDVLRTHCVDMD